MKVMKGKQSLEFEHPPYLKGWSSVVGEKEGEGPLGQAFDQIIDDPLFGQETWELAEGRFMRQAALLAIQKAEITKNQVRYAFAGDLLEQIMATSFGIKDLEDPSLWPVRSMFYRRRIHISCVYDGGCGICGLCIGPCLQSYRKCRKAVPFPAGIRQPETSVLHMDRDRSRGICNLQRKKPDQSSGHHNR